MNRPETNSSNIIYYDDFVDDDYFEKISQFSNTLIYRTPIGAEQNPLWQLERKATYPENTQSIVWTNIPQARESLGTVKDISIYPTGLIIDKLIEQIHQAAIETGLMGDIGREWIGTVSSIYKYEAGKSIKWHRDSGNYVGAFLFYLHPEWQRDWGGLLLHKSEESVDGSFLFPRPNRLVLLKAPCLHSVSPVSSPKESPRIALTGFFVKPEKAKEIISNYNAYLSD